ncbi:MAG TPA: hypothetical protein VKB26_12660 [Candidatus Acidoferrales bacterium]|nr:hypothetical protein [Candidatus Acidoferrales bacterium]
MMKQILDERFLRMRGIGSFLLALSFAVGPSLAAAPQSCPAGKPVTAFNLLVKSPKGGEVLPISEMNLIEPGDKLEYEPVKAAGKNATNTKSAKAKDVKAQKPDELEKPKGPSRVAILLASATGSDAGKIEVLEVKPASVAQEWTVPVRASVVGLVYGPDGLSEHKIDKLVKDNPELALKLTDYVEQTSKMEGLVQVLSKYQQSAPGTGNLQASLAEFSSQYGVSMPAVSSSETPDQQTEVLLHAVNPAFSSDPLAQTSMTAQSTGVAASVATFFMGPQFGIVAGGTVLLSELHTLMFPRAEFRAAFAQPLPTVRAGMDLCTGKPPAAAAKQHTRVAYLWALPVTNSEAPAMHRPETVHIPLGWKSDVKLTCATISQLKLVPRVREWHLVAGATDVAVPVKVTLGAQDDLLSLDLTHMTLAPGDYHLVAEWDWTPVTVGGDVDLTNFADYSTAALSTASRDELVSGAGPVKLRLSGPDFEFVNAVTLMRTPKAKTEEDPFAAKLPFSLPEGEEGGLQKTLSADVNTSHLEAGSYLLRLSQLNGKTKDIPVTVHPANPVLEGLPLRVNLGQAEQTVDLRGTALGNIEKITSEDATWTLGSPNANATDSAEREATIHLSQKAKQGALINAEVFVAGLEKPLEITGALRVAGPRPKILSARKSFAGAEGVALREKEIPAGSEVSFAIQGEHFDSRAHLHLECESPDDTLQDLNLTPGERNGANELDSAGDGTLFLSVNAGSIGQSGCELMATLTEADTGTSDPFSLGRVIRVPRIDKFSLTDEKLGDSLYAGILTGEDLQTIVKTGWDGKAAQPVQDIPTPVPGEPQEQTLKIAMSWPPPNPHALLYIWLSGETEARATSIKYQ